MIKVNVITGFLGGAGKTTFLKLLMNKQVFGDEKVIIIENEFGEVPIDDKILESEGYSLVEISGGCICCSLKGGDFIDALNALAENEQPDRIIIEPSGIFVLEDLFDLMSSPYLKDGFELDGILTVVDVKHFGIERMRYAAFFESQIKYANQLVISKMDQHTDESIDTVMDGLHDLNAKAAIHCLPINTWDRAMLRDLFDKAIQCQKILMRR